MALIAAVRKGNMAYFIDEKGEKMQIGDFQFTDNFSCGWACVNIGGDRIENPQGVVGGNFRYVNVAGEQLPIRMSNHSYFSNFLSSIDRGADYALIDVEGNVKTEGYQKLYPFSDGLAAASKSGNIGYLNTDGEWEFLMKVNDVIHSFSDGIAKVIRKDKIGFINPSGQWLIEPGDLKIFNFKERIAGYLESNLYGFVDDEGNRVTEPIFQDIGDFSEGLAAVKTDNKWGFINTLGEMVIPPLYHQVRAFSEGLAAIFHLGKAGFIDKTGSIVIDPKYHAAFDFKNGYALTQENEKIGYIDLTGDWVIKAIFDRANHFVDPDLDNPLFRAN